MKTTIHRGFAAMQIAALLAAMGAAAFPLAANATALPQCDNETSTHFYSQDAGTTVSPDAHAAVPVSSLNAAWTATPTIPGASWIWGEDPTADTVTGSVETFTRTFNVSGVPQDSLLQIAADNGYSVKVNGNSIGADPEEFNYQLGNQDMYNVPAADLNTGANTLEITVTNMPLENGTPATNPGGLLYDLNVNACPSPPTQTCTFVSDADTSENNHDSVLVSPINSAWTASIPEASWIWGENLSDADAQTDKTETFTRTFTVSDFASSTLDIASDNGYVVKVNGITVDDQSANPPVDNFSVSHHVPDLNLNTAIHSGSNTLEIIVTNSGVSGSTALSNPAGLLFKLVVNGSACGDVPPPDNNPPENSCVLPNAEGQTAGITLGNAPSGEDSVQTILNGQGYSLNADADQANYQQWDGSNKTVDFTVTRLSKDANSGHRHTFGYYINGDTSNFHAIFRDGADAAYSSAPLLAASSSQSFSVPNVADLEFVIHDATSGKYYSTKLSQNESGEQHSVVYNPSDNEYVAAFEDLPLGSSDKDYNDLVVKLKMTGCGDGKPETVTIIATKIVCPNEMDLPNDAGSSHDTNVNTASNFLSQHENCVAEPGWQFEWGDQNAGDGGDETIGHVEGYHTSDPTGEDGKVTMTVPLDGITSIHVREVLQDGYIGFTHSAHPDNSDNVSAELACGTDGLNYDNWDFINNPQPDHTYYCVAFNSPKEKAPVCDAEAAKVNLLQNPSFEAPTVLNAAKWDIFPSGAPGLAWNAAWYGGSATYQSHNRPETANAELQTSGLLGMTASEGSQWTELDADWDGPSGSLTGEPAPVTLSQDVPTVPGTKYTVSYDFMPRPSTAGADNKVEALADGTVESSADASDGSGWTTHTYTFTATNATTNIAFRDAGTPEDSLGTLIDNTSMNCVPPEEEQCPVGQHYNSDHRCVPDENDDNGADVSITKTVGRVSDPADTDIGGETTAPGDELVYTITVNNAGPDAANNVVVTDDLPDGVTYLSDSEAGAIEASGTVTWTIDSLPVGNASLNIFVTVNGDVANDTEIENTATVSSDNDSDIEDNDGSVTFTVAKESITTDSTTTKKKKKLGGQGGGGTPFIAQGEVLGESCGLYMEKYLKPGSPKNDPDQVTKLQIFLNTWMNANLPVTGFYGPLTIKALNAFQAKYADQILTPWGIQGPTSLVYLSTLREINLLQCPALSLQLPELVPWSQNPNAQ